MDGERAKQTETSLVPFEARKRSIATGTAEPVPDERILKRKMVFSDPPLCPFLHACILKGCPFKHQRTLLQPSSRMPRPIHYNICASDDCHAKALPGQFCCNPCESEYSGGARLFKQCPAHKGPCKIVPGSRHCSDCQGEEDLDTSDFQQGPLPSLPAKRRKRSKDKGVRPAGSSQVKPSSCLRVRAK